MRLSPWDHDLLSCLTLRLRLLSVEQIERCAWGKRQTSRDSVRARLGKLEQAGWVRCQTALHHPELPLAGPVLRWEVSDECPNYGAVSYALKSRWTLPLKSSRIVVASEKAAKLFGGSAATVRNEAQTTHDLHVAAVFLKVRAQGNSNEEWIGEDLVAKTAGKKHPDAFILSASGELLRWVEFGGSYRADTIEKLHQRCVELQVAFEVW
jgi:hypothetical protein